ncbi:polyketide synthase, partial [Arthroderma sp. PD_2]
SWPAAKDPLVGLTEALITKVSAVTMIDGEELGDNASIDPLVLDSLELVELRNWIRGETSVELLLSAVMRVESLRVLARDNLAQREGGAEKA